MKMVKRDNYIIEKRTTFKGWQYVITFTNIGHRCGYILFPKHIKFNEKFNLNINKLSDKYIYWENLDNKLDIPGGLTFLDYQNLDLNDPNKYEFFMGWDYIHSWNRPNYNQAIKYFPEIKDQIEQLRQLNSPIYKDEYEKFYAEKNDVEKDCKNIINFIVDNKIDLFSSEMFLPNLDMIAIDIINDNPSIKDFSINDKIVNYNIDISKFILEGKVIDGTKTIVENYELYPTFEYNSGIDIKTKEIIFK